MANANRTNAKEMKEKKEKCKPNKIGLKFI